jgi:hypothetical protein
MKAVRFYAEIGKLLYAVSAIDHQITLKERKRLYELMQHVLKKNYASDQFGTPAGNYIEIEFEFLEESIAEPQDALQSFLDYVEEHYSAIGKDDLEMIRELVWETAAAVRGISFAEQSVIDKMEHSFSIIKDKHKALLERYENKEEN